MCMCVLAACRMATKLGVSDAVYTSPSDVAFISKSPQQTTTFVNVTVSFFAPLEGLRRQVLARRLRSTAI